MAVSRGDGRNGSPGTTVTNSMFSHVSAGWRAGRGWVRRALPASAALLGVALLVVALQVRLALLPLSNDPAVQAIDWTPLKSELARRGLDGMTIAAPTWSDTGKIDYALGGSPRVYCVNMDFRQYRFGPDPRPSLGSDVLIIAPRQSVSRMQEEYAPHFDSFETLPPLSLQLHGRPKREFALFFGHRLRSWTY